MFIKPIFYFAVRKFVCTLGATTNIYGRKYRIQANLVKARVNVPITLLHIYWAYQYKLFLISAGWEGFTEPSKPSLEYHIKTNSDIVFSSFILDSDFGFKYLLEIVCTKITL